MRAENIKKLKKLGVELWDPNIEEGRYQMSTASEVIQTIIHMLE